MKDTQKDKKFKKLNSFQIIMLILCIILFIGIIVQICFMVDLQTKTIERQQQEQGLPNLPEENGELENYINEIERYC